MLHDLAQVYFSECKLKFTCNELKFVEVKDSNHVESRDLLATF